LLELVFWPERLASVRLPPRSPGFLFGVMRTFDPSRCIGVARTPDLDRRR
jgi:hypothetical protein